MSERLRAGKSETGLAGEAERKTSDPAERFRVEATDYPIFRKQSQLNPNWGDNSAEVWGIDKTLSEYVTSTASLIAELDGTAEVYAKKPELEKPDHVIYLDKSARPVSWLVNLFWKDFSEAERPAHSYMNVDRMPWLRAAGLEMDAGGYIREPDGSARRPDFNDFKKNADKIPEETFARIRALYIPGGVETEDLDEIRKMPTALDGKNVMIIDEVADTGATLAIAKYLLGRAIPEIKSINGTYFWEAGTKTDGVQRQQLSVPVWYSHQTSVGRGIGDVNEPFFQERYRQNPTPKTRAQALGALALSEFVDLSKEAGGASRELAREMRKMHDDYKEGKILLRYPKSWEVERVADAIEAQGLRLAPQSDRSPETFLNVMRAIDARGGVNRKKSPHGLSRGG